MFIFMIISLVRLFEACYRRQEEAHERAFRREQERLDAEPLIREEPVQTPQQHYSFVEPTTAPEYTQPPLKDDAHYD